MHHIVRAFACAAAIAVGLAIITARTTTLTAAGAYPAPRYPKYLRTVSSIDPLMVPARLAARQIAGRTPLGLVKTGEKLLIVTPDEQDPIVREALDKALGERNIKVTWATNLQMQGFTPAQIKANLEARKAGNTYGSDGWREVGTYQRYVFRFLPANVQKEIAPKPLPFESKITDLDGTVAYLEKHPEIDRVIYGAGGRARQQRAFGKNAGKFVGNWTYVLQSDLLSKVPEFPGDVWKLVEEKVLDSLAFIESVHITDPEGTDVRWAVTETEAEHWAKAAYLQGHLFLYPFQGSRGILEAAFDTQVFPDSNGVIAGCADHVAYFPCMKTYIEHGMIARIEGGGKKGDLARMLLQNPELKNTQWPTAPKPGYWYWFEAALGTNPKYFRPLHQLMAGGNGQINMFERNRSGIFHFGMGLETLAPAARKMCEAKNLPCDHAWHYHNYFITYEAKLRDEETKINIVDKGHLTPMDNAEVRALASRYGNPDLIMREEWVPGIPGINEPGDYQKDYAPDPWKYIKASGEQIEKGTYPYLQDGYPTPEGLIRRSQSTQ